MICEELNLFYPVFLTETVQEHDLVMTYKTARYHPLEDWLMCVVVPNAFWESHQKQVVMFFCSWYDLPCFLNVVVVADQRFEVLQKLHKPTV